MSVKFRKPGTDKVLEVSKETRVGQSFCLGKICEYCKMFEKTKRTYCTEWVLDHPEEAASLMGYELVRDEESNPVEPPVALMPEHIWKEQRFNSICHAIARYVFAGLDPLPEWVEEGRRLMKELEADGEE